MKIVRTVAELRAALAPTRRAGRSIGLVPTMGALHDGHLSLMRRARQPPATSVVVSLFVNPPQFNEAGDLDAYPRDESSRRRARCRARRRLSVRPGGRRGLSRRASAPRSRSPASAPALRASTAAARHFDGVATVVAKLLNMVAPDVAYFGQKDAQQAVVIRRMVARPRPAGADRGLPDRPRRRRPGSLQPQRAAVRRRARARHRALPRAASRARRRGRRRARPRPRDRRRPRSSSHAAGIDVEYLSLVDPETMAPAARAARRRAGRRRGPRRRGAADRQRPDRTSATPSRDGS